MTPAKLIQDARSNGVLLTITPSGTLKAMGDKAVVGQWTPKIRLHRLALLETLRSDLALFRFDLTDRDIAADIDAGYPATDIVRVNNMAWEFMKADGLPFNEAMDVAAEIVTTCPSASCETTYEDVQALWRHISGRTTHD